MSIKLRVSALAAVAVAAIAGPALAASDISGLWFIERVGAPKNLPLTAEGQARIDKDKARVAAGMMKNERSTRCLPTAMPIMMSNEFGLGVFQVEGKIAMLSENNIVPRVVYTDGRKHPDKPDPSWNGHAIGWWEGDTLVIDTVGFNDRYAVYFGGVRRTPTLHVTERLHLEEGGKVLINELTAEDPATFSKPVTQRYRYNRLPPEAEYMEYVCEIQLEDLQQYEAWNAAHPDAPAKAETVKSALAKVPQ
jgi:hypothetical protein